MGFRIGIAFLQPSGLLYKNKLGSDLQKGRALILEENMSPDYQHFQRRSQGMQGVWLAHLLSMQEWHCHCGKKREVPQGPPTAEAFLRCSLCSLGLTLKGIIPAVHVVFLDDLAALNSPLCVFVCGSGFSLVMPSAQEHGLSVTEAAVNFSAARMQRESGLPPLGAFISHLKDGDISRNIGSDFFFF